MSIADLKAANDDYGARLGAALGGGSLAIAAQNAARTRLTGLLRNEAHYVQIVAGTDLMKLLSSGFTAIDRNSAQRPLTTPFIRRVLRPQSEQLRLVLKPVPNARSYQVQLKVGDGDWQDGGIHSQARKLILTGLVPGTVYQIRIRALGGSTRYSAWSTPTSCMAV